MSDTRNLKDSPVLQQQMSSMPQEMYASLEENNASLQALIVRKDAEIARLNEIIHNLQKALFGRKSEKSSVVIPGQLSLFDDPEPAPPPAVIPQKQVVAGHTRKPKRTQDEIYASLPLKKVILDLPEEQKIGADGKPMECIGMESCGTVVIHKRAEFYRQETLRKIYVDRSREAEFGESIIAKPSASKALIEHSFASASLVSLIILNKYFSSMPLYRQEQSFKARNFPLKRATMANWVIIVAQTYLYRLYLRLKELLIAQPVIHADETPLKVLKEPGRTPEQKSYIWAYASSKRAAVQIRCFEYQSSRAGDCPENFLKGFHGTLISDGYAAYGTLTGITRAGCWAHMRRKWIDAMPKAPSAQRCAQSIGIDFCNRLFELERRYEAYSDEDRRVERNRSFDEAHPDEKSSAVVLEEYWTWIENLGATSGKLAEAIKYAKNQKPFLETFLQHGEIEISNNQVENAIRPIVVGRKNWLFSDTPEGAKSSAMIYSIIETAKANGLNVEDWLTYVLETLPDRFADNPSASIDDLLPWAEEMRKFALQ